MTIRKETKMKTTDTMCKVRALTTGEALWCCVAMDTKTYQYRFTRHSTYMDYSLLNIRQKEFLDEWAGDMYDDLYCVNYSGDFDLYEHIQEAYNRALFFGLSVYWSDETGTGVWVVSNDEGFWFSCFSTEQQAIAFANRFRVTPNEINRN